MKVEYRHHELRKKRSNELWKKIVKAYNKGFSIRYIQKKYPNPHNGKAYTRQHIYLILRKMSVQGN